MRIVFLAKTITLFLLIPAACTESPAGRGGDAGDLDGVAVAKKDGSPPRDASPAVDMAPGSDHSIPAADSVVPVDDSQPHVIDSVTPVIDSASIIDSATQLDTVPSDTMQVDTAPCSGPPLQICVIPDGEGIQSRTCLNGSWSVWSSCIPVSCNSGFEISGDQCVPISTCSGLHERVCFTIPNGYGMEQRICNNGNWALWSVCELTACHRGYLADAAGSACIVDSETYDYEIHPDLDILGETVAFSIQSSLGDVTSYEIAGVWRGGIPLTPPYAGKLEVPLTLVGAFSFDTTSGAFSWRPTPLFSGAYRFDFLVSNSANQSETITKRIRVIVPQTCDHGVCGTANQDFTDRIIAGNVGDLYNNRDNFHSNISVDYHLPQGDLMMHNPASALYKGDPYPGWVVFGNASRAYTTGDNWASLLRYNMFSQYTLDKLYGQYIANTHYWYPEHRDHDDKDQFHGKIPYVGISQGSSGSETGDLRAMMLALRDLKPDVKARLARDRYRVFIDGKVYSVGLLVPTLQMIYRRASVATDAEYLSAQAHPSAFDNNYQTSVITSMARALEVDDLPPMVQLEVQSETFAVYNNKEERLFTTPASICRIFREQVYTPQMVVSAQKSFDTNGRPLTFHWVVLRGDPQHVRVTPLGADQAMAQIEIDYHPETTIDGTIRLTNMVEVGVFVHNGAYYSAPGFITSFTLNNEERTYDAAGNLQSIQTNSNYVHPFLL